MPPKINGRNGAQERPAEKALTSANAEPHASGSGVHPHPRSGAAPASVSMSSSRSGPSVRTSAGGSHFSPGMVRLIFPRAWLRIPDCIHPTHMRDFCPPRLLLSFRRAETGHETHLKACRPCMCPDDVEHPTERTGKRAEAQRRHDAVRVLSCASLTLAEHV